METDNGLWDGCICVLRRCGQIAVVRNSTGQERFADVMDVPRWVDDSDTRVDELFECRDAVLKDMYEDVNCLGCAYNKWMHLEIGSKSASLLVDCSCPGGRTPSAGKEAFAYIDGEFIICKVNYCYPRALTPVELDDRARDPQCAKEAD